MKRSPISRILIMLLSTAMISCTFWGCQQDEIASIGETDPIHESQAQIRAIVREISDSHALVEPLEGEDELRSSDLISFGTAHLEDIGAQVGSMVEINYAGRIMESYPAQINAVSWKLIADLRQIEYTDQWISKTEDLMVDNNIFSDVVISKIYSNCFFARCVIPMPYEIRLNGTLSEEWCVGDQVSVTFENTYYDEENQRLEADLLSITVSDFKPEEFVYYKPVIYLYPEKEMHVDVRLSLNGELTCTYPKYNDGWQVTAMPNGTLWDENRQCYNYLYWEGEICSQYDFSKGFCVKGEDTAAFLEEALAQLGLTRQEANEFIVYWLPLMEQNPYNIITFQTDAYTDSAKLQVCPAPDTTIRVFMAWQTCEEFIPMEEQVLTAPERNGFTVVEWGGTEIQ